MNKIHLMRNADEVSKMFDILYELAIKETDVKNKQRYLDRMTSLYWVLDKNESSKNILNLEGYKI